MAMGSLILGPFIIRFEMQLLLLSLEREFGKLRFLKGWVFFFIIFFMWIAAHGQILTFNNIMLRGCPLANRCCLCCCNAETVDHMLLFCLIAHSL